MKNIISTFNFITIFMYVTWGILPFFQRNIPSSAIIILVLFWSIFNLIDVVLNNKKIKRIYLIGIYSIFFYVIQYLRVYSFVAIGNLFNQILFIFPGFMYYSVRNLKQRRILFYYIIFLIACIIVTNVFILLEDPNASKFMTGSVEVALERYGNSNVATVNHVTFVAILFPIIVYLYGKTKKKIYIFFIILINYFVYLSGASITLITLLFTLVLLFYYKLRGALERVIMLFIISILIAVLLIYRHQMGVVIQNWAYHINNALYSTRLIEISEVLKGSETQGSFTSRMADMKTSIITFLDNPVFGKGLIYHNDIKKTGIGMHSHVFDELARFGLFGFMLLVIYIRETYHHTFINRRDVKVINTVKIIFISLSFFALFNIMINPVYGILIFFVIPLFLELSNLNEENDLLINKN